MTEIEREWRIGYARQALSDLSVYERFVTDPQFRILKVRILAPKGPKQISPGQRPGFCDASRLVALKGHDKVRLARSVVPFQGVPHVGPVSQGVALG